MQNTSHAVMAQRHEPADSTDNFPTPPWAVRGLMEHVLSDVRGGTCLEPACGQGYMGRVLREFFGEVDCFDANDYGYGGVRDFLASDFPKYDWVITNPPFRLAEDFIVRALDIAAEGVAMLARTVFLESVGRYERLYRDRPPSIVAQYVERVPMVKGRLDRNASTATGYAWFIWRHGQPSSRIAWIPPCRKGLERDDDYTCAGGLDVIEPLTSSQCCELRPDGISRAGAPDSAGDTVSLRAVPHVDDAGARSARPAETNQVNR